VKDYITPAADIVFYAGDVLYDENLKDIGVLLERFETKEEDGVHAKVPVWRTWWIHAGEELYSEEGLQHLVALDVFICYSIEGPPSKLEKF
jgi:hypothetical protein